MTDQNHLPTDTTTSTFSISTIKSAFRPLFAQERGDLQALEEVVDKEIQKGLQTDNPVNYGISLLCYITAQHQAGVISFTEYNVLKEKIESAVNTIDPSVFDDGQSLRPGRIINGKYFLREKIGVGGMGVVWKAYNLIAVAGSLPDDDSFVAIKFLNEEFSRDSLAYKTLAQEFNNTQQLQHENIIRFYDITQFGETICIIMEYLHGMPLNEFIEKHPEGISLEEAGPIIRGMCRGLSYAHGKKMAHLDFKPGNVFYNPRKQILKILDFGIARTTSHNVEKHGLQGIGTTAHHAFGASRTVAAEQLNAYTERYASLEMLVGGDEYKPTPSDDVYSLACVIYELLTGQHPFGVNAMVAKAGDIEPESISSFPRSIRHALQGGLALKSGDRFTSVDEFFDTLYAPASPFYQRPEVISAGILLLLVVTGLGIWQSYITEDPTPEPVDPYVLPAPPEPSPPIPLPAEKLALTIRTNVPDPAIYINKQRHQSMPVNLAAGSYTIRVEKAGYEPRQQVVELQQDKTIDISLTPKTAVLRINTDISDARIYINDKLYTSLPVTEKLSWGTYRVRIEKQGYKTWQQVVELRKNETITVPMVKNTAVLSISVNIPDARVYINDKPYTSLPVRETLFWGKHTVRIEKQGYETWLKVIELNQNQTLNIALSREKPTTHILTVRSNVSGDRVYINDKFYGTTPVTETLPLGDYSLRIEKDGYESWQKTVTLTQNKNVNAQLEKISPPVAKTAMLTIRANVNEARVYINDKSYGTTPITESLPLDDYIIRIEKDGYVTWQDAVTLTQNESVRALLEKSSPPVAKTAMLTIRSNVNEDRVYINDQLYGATPITESLPFNEYNIRVEKDGYESWQETVTLTQNKRITAQLKRISSKTAVLTITSNAHNTRIFIDDRLYTFTPVKETLTLGKHVIRAEKDDFPPKTWNITLTGNEEIKADFTYPTGREFRDKLSIGSGGPRMTWLPPGNLPMGSAGKPVEIRQIAMGVNEVTYADYDKFVKATGRREPDYKSEPRGRNIQPVSDVSFRDAAAYAAWLSAQTGKIYRLPTGAEWEYAARANSQAAWHWGNDPEVMCEYANVADRTAKDWYSWRNTARCDDNYHLGSPVGKFMPNNFNLYDMIGNVWEWTCSEYAESYDNNDEHCLETDYAVKDSLISVRGGSWSTTPPVSTEYREAKNPDERERALGFRLVRE